MENSDAVLKITIKGQSHFLIIEEKNNGQPRYARQAVLEIAERLRGNLHAYGIFIAPYISPESAKICQEAGIGYCDAAGNCLISFDTVYIRQSGNPNPNIQKRALRSLYSPKAERILRVLLSNPNQRWKMVELSKAADVSLGQVANVKKVLLDKEWLDSTSEGIYLSNPSALLNEWSTAYDAHRNTFEEYYALAEIADIETRVAEVCQQLNIRYALTAFSGAARLAPMVRYQKAHIYISGNVKSLANTLGLKSVQSGGNVSLITPYDEGVFQGVEGIENIVMASPVQIYLDLLNLRARGQEAAQSIREKMEKTWQ